MIATQINLCQMTNPKKTQNNPAIRIVKPGVLGLAFLICGCSSVGGSFGTSQEFGHTGGLPVQQRNPFAIAVEAAEHRMEPLQVVETPPNIGSPTYRARVLQRAVQTEGATSVTPAHYDHVIAGPNSPAITSLKTIPLLDAVQNNVLIEQDYAVKEISSINDAPKKWVVLEGPIDRPSPLEGAGGDRIEDGIYAVVPFEKTQYQASDLSSLLGNMVRRAQLVPGAFYVVGYTKKGERADPSNELKKNLSTERALFVAKAIEDAGIAKSRIKVSDGGVSSLDSSDHPASRVSVSFRVFR